MPASKPPVILIHGFRGAPLGLTELATKLSQHFQVFIPPIPPTNTLLDAYTPKTYADYLAGFIKSQNLKKPIIIGHSMGSIIAAATAHYYPDLIADRIFFLAPIAKHPPRFIAPLTPLITILPNRLISSITTRYLFAARLQTPSATRQLYRKCLDLTIKSADQTTDCTATRRAAEFSCRFGIADFDFAATPTFIVGQRDRLANFKDLRALASRHPGSSLKILPNCGHLLNYECPARVAKAIFSSIAS